MDIKLDPMLLAPLTRVWLYQATEQEITRIVEIGYKVYHESKKESTDLDILAATAVDNKREINNIKDILEKQPEKFQSILELHSMKGNQNGKATYIGQEGEEEAFNILNEHFENVRDMHDKPHSGDYFVDDRVLVEVKNYSNNVPKREVEKFKRDLESTGKQGGVFWSLNTPISNIGSFKQTIHIINGREVPVMYVYTRNKDVIRLSIELIRAYVMGSEIIGGEENAIINSIVKERIIQLEQNLKTIITIRNTVKKMAEQFSMSTDSLLLQLATLEGTSQTNIEVIKRELNMIKNNKKEMIDEKDKNKTNKKRIKK